MTVSARQCGVINSNLFAGIAKAGWKFPGPPKEKAEPEGSALKIIAG
jgi:hypothetical protein